MDSIVSANSNGNKAFKGHSLYTFYTLLKNDWSQSGYVHTKLVSLFLKVSTLKIKSHFRQILNMHLGFLPTLSLVQITLKGKTSKK